ncbi:gluconate 2-dehydrogenase subunit 3 family protein [Peristeroidobacter soli]|uniref:gluconate 2-dehydrogenase subunit 3 family protein n=1 Tax=Peristeroidobacter soli TaxID=2497877 RepID=UPI00101CB525|nr:gluconate 2-dehydrogenase subunit 3 family protein [Peristeroidobacter soli]
MPADGMTRRTALKYISVIALAANSQRASAGRITMQTARGYGTDPDRLQRMVTWSRTLSKLQLATLSDLSEIVLPAEPPHPSAKDLGVYEFLDEWLSAPYRQMRTDRIVILEGLVVLDHLARQEIGTSFSDANRQDQDAVFACSLITPSTKDFSHRLIELICAGYYTSREGHIAIGYVGNVALSEFPVAPSEVLRRFEIAIGAV